jgi:D-hexose-6-phosphate mutarotase
MPNLDIPGLAQLQPGNGGLPKVSVTTPWSQAEVYLHGAQITAFQKKGEPPLLFLSQCSHFASGKAIRGGVPICFPWFGSRAGDVAHGFARISDWELTKTAATREGGATLRFELPESTTRTGLPKFKAEFVVSVTEQLAMELIVTNRSSEQNFCFESCLHTYFTVGEIGAITITGLESTAYLDKTDQRASRAEGTAPIRICSQTDRTYLNTTGAVEIHDPLLHRTIRIDKTGSASTVVWNPWSTQHLSDFGPDEYRRMVCVESGNVERNAVTVPPGASAQLRVLLSTRRFLE